MRPPDKENKKQSKLTGDPRGSASQSLGTPACRGIAEYV